MTIVITVFNTVQNLLQTKFVSRLYNQSSNCSTITMNGNQPPILKDQKEKQSSFQEVVNNEKLLWATIQHKGISHLEVQDLYIKVRSGYEQIILNNYQEVDLQEIEYSLWKLHYKHIDEYRKKIKKVSAGTESTNNLNTHVEGFKLFLSKVAEFYKDLIAKFRKTCDLSEQTLLKKSGGSVSIEPAILQKCHYVCHRFLVCLGDLSRYVELCKKPDVQKWGVAATYYLEASMVWPHSGNPQNQLALLATYIGDDFLALYHCVRSLAVKEPFPDAQDNIMLLFEKNKSSQLQSLSTNAHIDFSKPLTRLSSQIKSHSSMDSTNINKLGHHEHVFPVKTDLWPLFVRMISFFLVKPSFEDLPHTFASTMKELEALLELNDIELNSALEPYEQFDSSRKGPYRALQSVTILIFVIHNLIKTPELKELKAQKDEQLSACTSWAWTCTFTFMGHLTQRCLTATDGQNCCSLLPAVLVFLEWYVGMIDFAESCDDEKVSNAKSYFLGALVDLVSGFEENLNFANQIALWEDYELRGFEPVSQSTEILDFCNSDNRGKFECGNSIRVNRVLHASMKIADRLNCSLIMYDGSTRKFLKKNEREIVEETSSMEEEEVILFKPLTRYNSEPIQTETSDQENLRRSASLIAAQNEKRAESSAGPPSLSGWVLNRESLNLERERGTRSPNKRELSPISEMPTSSYVAPVPSAPLLPEGFNSGVPGFVDGFRPPVFGLSSSEWLYRYTNNLSLEPGDGNLPNSNHYLPVLGSNPAGNVGNFHGYGGGSRYDVVDRWGNPLLTNRMVYLESPRERFLFGGHGGGGGGGAAEQPPVLQHVKEREWQLPNESPFRGHPYMGN
ncbi:hypothetical protein L1887_34535 [Cichorium endivia]|nr:hypothetical protein L1887_34535 [Cichorium endivia]